MPWYNHLQTHLFDLFELSPFTNGRICPLRREKGALAKRLERAVSVLSDGSGAGLGRRSVYIRCGLWRHKNYQFELLFCTGHTQRKRLMKPDRLCQTRIVAFWSGCIA